MKKTPRKTEVIDIGHLGFDEWQEAMVRELKRREATHLGWTARPQIVLEDWSDDEVEGAPV